MVNELLQKKVHDVLKTGYFNGPDDAVDVSVGPGDNLHLVIVSRKFDGKRLKDRHELIWSELLQHLGADEWGKISLSIGTSPEELKAI
jgi:stress-induced morphogen